MIVQRLALVVLAVAGEAGILIATSLASQTDVSGDGVLFLLLAPLAVSTFVLSNLILRGPIWRRIVFMVLNTALTPVILGVGVSAGSGEELAWIFYALASFAEIMLAFPLNIPLWFACAAAALWLGDRPPSKP